MRVQMKVKIGGYRNEAEWPEVGGVIDVPDHEARDLIAVGYAKEANNADESEPEPVEPAADGDEEAADEPADLPADDGDTEAVADESEPEPEPVVTLTAAEKRAAAKAAKNK